MAERGDIDEIRERVDIVELVGAKVQLKRSGKSWKGNCPFHNEKTPSFYVFPESGNYKCFGCQEGGDAFKWLMKTEGVDFAEALTQLAARTGVQLKSRGTVKDPSRDETRERIYALNAEAAAFYANILHNAPAGAAGRRYVAERGLTRETAERFNLGFAPDAWDALLKHLKARGHSEAQLVEAGLIRERESGGHYDYFRNRLLFPIRDRDGKLVGFGGRALGDAKPKYLNSAQNAVFDKQAVLYGIDRAKEAIRTKGVAVIVEGYMDAIMAHQVGYANVVASMGTALTEKQVRLLNRLTGRIVLALDADAAGQAAMLHGIDTMRGALDYDEVAVADGGFDPRQIVHFEKRLKTEILVLSLPEGKDPDEFLRARPAEWPALVAGAEPLLDFMIRAVAGPVDLTDPRAKSAAVEHLAPLIREAPDDIQRHHYVAMLARALRLPEDVVASAVRKGGADRGKGRASPGTGGRSVPAAPAAVSGSARAAVSREEHLLGLALAFPEVARDLAGEIGEDDFAGTTNRLLWGALRAAAEADPRLKGTDFVAGIENEELREAAAGLVAALGDRPVGGTSFPILLRQEARDSLRLLRQEAYQGRVRQLQVAIDEARDAEDREALGTLFGQLAALAAARYTFDPAPSPYFHDLRTTAEKR